MTTLIIYLLLLVVVTGLALAGIWTFYSWLFDYLEKDSKSSMKYLIYSLLLFIPAPVYVAMTINKLSEMSSMALFNTPAIIVFMLSSFFGLAIFILFFNYAFERKIKNALIMLFMGSVLFLVFAPSAYFTFAPFVKNYYADKEQDIQLILTYCNEEKRDYYCEELAERYIDGEGVEQSYTKAIEIYEDASDRNDTSSIYKLGIIYEEGKLTKQNFQKAIEYYLKACNLGSDAGCLKVAESHFKGRGIAQNESEAEAIYFKHCIGRVEEGCSYYLDIHEAKSWINYSTDKEFNGKLIDDPSNWSRAFGTSEPDNILMLKSLFKSSSGLCCTKYSFYFKIAMDTKDREIALSRLEKFNEDVDEDVFPKNFLKDKELENYRFYKERDVFIWVHKITNHIYIQYDGYIEGN